MTALASDVGRRAWQTSPWALLALLLAAAGGLVWLVTEQPQRGWPAAETVPVTLGGEHYRVTPGQLEWLAAYSELHFTEGEQAARALAAAEIEARVDQLFDGVHARLPAFADWYYSLGGEYTRLAMLALSWVDLAEGDYVARRAAQMLFPTDVWDRELTRLDEHTARRLRAHQEQVRTGWLSELSERLAAQRVPAPLEDGTAPAARVRLDALAEQLLARERAALEGRALASTMAASGAAAAPALLRAAARRGAATAGRVAGRGAARAGSAAAGGAALCGPGGPVAVACAVLAGAGAWIATDWVLLRVDEHVHREEMLTALGASLDGLREEMNRELLAAYEELIAGHYAAVQRDIEHTFVPARAAGR